jgi:glycosyltransferase involved in cell wall biosynthesis
MKILQVISSFPPAYSYGGPAKAAYDLSKKLVERGHSVTVFTTDVLDSESRFSDKELISDMDGIEVYRFRNISNYLAQKNYSLAPQIALASRVNLKNYDIVHIHEYRSFQAIIACYYARKYGVPYVIQARGSVLPFFKMQWMKKLYDQIWGFKQLKGASRVIASTQEEAKQYIGMGVPVHRIQVIPNSINVTQYGSLPPNGLIRQKFGIPWDVKIILSLGRLHKIKGIDLLLFAFSDVIKHYSSVRLIIAGPDHGELNKLQKLVKELHLESVVLFTGPLYGEEKVAAYNDADLFVLPSVYESFGNTVLEALACGTPVIVTTGCHIANVVEKVGLVVERDSTLLSEAIIKSLENDELRYHFGERGRKMVFEEFSDEVVIKKIEDIYRTCIRDVE